MQGVPDVRREFPFLESLLSFQELDCAEMTPILQSVTEYCERPVPKGQQCCRDIGALKQWTIRQAGNDAFKAYRKEYKRRFAWIKAGRISDEAFYAWSEQARAQKKECDEGTIALEDFQRWLKES